MNLLPPPGPQRRRQLMMLGLLLVVLTVVGWRYLASANPAPAPQAAAPGPQSPTPLVPIGQGLLPAPVSLAKLEAVSEVPENGRNLFRFGERPAPPPQKVAPPPVTPPPVAAPPPPVGPPPITLKLIGITTGGDGRPVAVLKDPRTGATFMGSDGMIVDGQYKIIRVAVTSVQVSYADGTGMRTIPLGS